VFCGVQLTVAVDLLEAANIPSPYYTVEFGTAAIGMILTITDKLEVKVVDMRSDSSGRPLAALASGKIAIGDVVLAVNGVPLMNHRTLESVAEEFRRAKRPARVLFERAAPQSE
jgi:C-terminal processing protease CtpA/Prc